MNEHAAVETAERGTDFVRKIVIDDNSTGKWGGRVATRFPPEPNGYLHIGHAKSICLNFGIAQEFGGTCKLRMDDTNPAKEEQEYVDSISEDVRWLGWQWEGKIRFASDYFDQMYGWAEELIRKGKAFVCDMTADDVGRTRGTTTEPAKASPYRDRPVEESLDLFRRMKAGEFPDGARTLRAKIDLASPNFMLRDPIMYRIVHAEHHNTGSKWCIYPMYDWAHGLEDSIEGITHSICTLEFEVHRPLYDWYLDAINEGRTDDGSGLWGKKIHHARQIEFARLNLSYTVLSKRKLLELVQAKIVRGWDDPRMPTISGIRRRGYTPEAIRDFAKRIGVNKFDSTVDVQLLEHCLREDLNKKASRVMAVLRPLKLVIENYPDGKSEELDAVNNPNDPAAGTRKVPFSKTLYIEVEDFMEEPPKKFFRLAPGREVRLRYAYFVTCKSVVKDAAGRIVALRCTYDPATRGGDAPDGRKPKATLHWVSAEHAAPIEARLYGQLFSKPEPGNVPEGVDWKTELDPKSEEVVRGFLESSAASAPVGAKVQFERLGYFCVDKDSKPGSPVFNRAVGLKDAYAAPAKKP
ncbi:MAG: glutamine--tRNA ligase/YqeY domain fusion protein [Elusimicrobia bacterium]|nr:glutamine--tRNA ligase/YqeY domain fusion protein [Elusimicrobiota bacterium]